MCSEPTSLAVLMAKADKYATANFAMQVKVTASDKIVPMPSTPKPAGDNRGGPNNKRKADQLDSRSASKQVAYLVFTSEGGNKHSQRQHRHEVIDLALELINTVIEPGEVLPNVNGIHLVIVGELRDHHVVGVGSTLHHPLALEDLLLHCFEPRLDASGLLRPLNITDVQHPLAHLDRLGVL
ncbi:hypothetical protein D1007_17199 [Hordeum vulgare]|nr:hypothetical protein D1007_17199 [Hordeum vulgare]